MNLICRFAVITLFLAGLVTVGILGTSSEMTFVWPGYLVIGLAGVASVIAIFRRTKYAVPSWCMVAAFAMAGYLLIRAMTSPVAYFAREDGALLITCFIAYAVFMSMLDDSRWRTGLFWCIAGVLGLNCAMAAAQLIFGADLWILPGYERTFTNRIGGLYNHPDHFAGFLAMGIPFLLSAIIFGKHSRGVRIFLGTLSGLCLIGIILSESLLGVVAAMFGLSITGAIVLLLSWKKMVPSTRKAIVKSSVFLLILLSGFVVFNSTRIGHVVDTKILSREGQISLPGVWRSSIEQFSEAPLAGTGSRTFYFFSRKYRPEEEGPAKFESEFVHNEYLQLLADYGIIGLLLALTFVGIHFSNGFKFVRGYAKFQSIRGAILPRSNHLAMVAGAIASLGTVAFLSTFDFVMHIPSIAVMATVLVGVLACPDPMSAAMRPEEEDTYIPGGSFLFLGRGLAFGCGVALTIFSCIFSRSEWHLEVARNAYESGNIGPALDHLEIARKIDPQNPFAKSLSAHTYVLAIKPDMTEQIRKAYLEKAETLFAEADELYPQDINSAIAHSVVLDALGRPSEAGKRIREARQWAPRYGNLLIAQAEHFLRNGEYDRAGKSYEMARNATVFPNPGAIEKGLAILAQRKPGLDPGNPTQIAESGTKTIKDAMVREVELSGDIQDVETALDESIRKLEARLDSGKVKVTPGAE